MMTSLEERKSTVLALAGTRLGGAPERFESPLTVLASPAWRGIEADIWVAGRGDAAEVYKHYHPDTAFYVDAAAAIGAARIAGDLGVAPQVGHVWPEQGLFVMSYLGAGWRAGGLHDAVDLAVRGGVVAAKKAIQTGPRFARDGDIFADIEGLVTHCRTQKAVLPRPIDAFLAFTEQARQAIRACGADRVPCHRDGNTSNLMIGPAQAVLLLDYDLAANADPFEDLGCHLMEMFEREPEARAGYEEWMGSFDESLFQRAMVYGILDDLRWGLIATAMAATSPRRSLEFAKYASWRYLRFEQNSQRSIAADRLRRLV